MQSSDYVTSWCEDCDRGDMLLLLLTLFPDLQVVSGRFSGHDHGTYIQFYHRICFARVKENGLFLNIFFYCSLDLDKCLKQIKLPITLHTWAPIF